MDNAILVFIIILEAVIIIWLLSKLKQYRRFDHILTESSSANRAVDAAQGTESTATQTVAQTMATANPSSVAEPDDLDDELLDMPGVDSEVNIEQAKRVQLVMARCRYAEFYLEQLDDDYERGQFERIVDSCRKTAQGIADPFFNASALHPIILLLDRANWVDQRDAMMAEVQDDIIRQRIESELEATEA